MADYAPKLDRRESLTWRERRIIDRTLGMDEQLVLVTRPDPTILKAELIIHFGMAALVFIVSEAELFELPFVILLCVIPWFRKRYKRRTLYLVTDRRCIILTPGLLPGMKCKSYPLEPNRIKEYEIFSGGIGNIAFDYVYTEDSRHPLGFLDLPQCKRVVTLIRKQINHADVRHDLLRKRRILLRAHHIIVIITINHRAEHLIAHIMRTHGRKIDLRIGLARRIHARKAEHEDENDNNGAKQKNDQP